MKNIIAIIFFGVCSAMAVKPNIIFLLADDRGLETSVPDGNANGWVTPNIDSIATNGMRFTQMQATATCAPSRASFITGRYSGLRLDPAITSPTLQNGPMSTDEITIADSLSAAGYETAICGKWNLYYGSGLDTQENLDIQRQHILDCGFDTNYTFIGNTVQYWGDENTAWGTGDGYALGGESNYSPFLVNEWALDYIETQSSNSAPFYLQYSFGLPHYGTVYQCEVTPNNLALSGLDGDDPANYPVLIAGMYAYHDLMVSNVLAKLDELGISSNTVVIYSADNGTDSSLTNSYNGTDVAGGKSTRNAVGSLVPFYIEYPGVISPSTSFSKLSSYVDIYNLLIKIGGGVIPSDRTIDGRSLIYDAVFNGGGGFRDNVYISRVQPPGGRPVMAEVGWRYENGNLYEVAWPFYDTLTDPSSTALASNAYLRLSRAYETETNRVFGVGFNGVTNEFIYGGNL